MLCFSIPGTALVPSRLCLGTGYYGTMIPCEQAWQMLDRFVELGGTFLDTAYVYAAWLPGGEGASERCLGEWIRARGVRGEVVLATKGGCADYPRGNAPRLRPEEITHDLLISLERLQAPAVDLYWLHRDDPLVSVGEILGVLNEHYRAGRVRAIGASNWRPERLRQAAQYAGEHGLVAFCASQIRYSLAQASFPAGTYADTWSMDADALAMHRASGLPVVAYSSQALGFFSGKYAPGEPIANEELARLYDTPANWVRLARAGELAARHGCTANQVALAYLLQQPFPVYPIVGCRTLEQLEASCGALDVRLQPEELAYLESGAPEHGTGAQPRG